MVNLKVTGLHPKLADALTSILTEMKARKLNVGMHSGVRDFATQKRLYLLGREIINPDGFSIHKPMGNIVTNADAFSSFHEYGLSADLVPKDEKGNWTWNWPSENWEEMGKFGESLGLEWGGRWRFKDMPHFQLKTKLSMNDIRKVFFTEGLDTLWTII
jgi:peptidoglycan L-alanyl-D-glutamate endopeptidase CwlK